MFVLELLANMVGSHHLLRWVGQWNSRHKYRQYLAGRQISFRGAVAESAESVPVDVRFRALGGEVTAEALTGAVRTYGPLKLTEENGPALAQSAERVDWMKRVLLTVQDGRGRHLDLYAPPPNSRLLIAVLQPRSE